MRGRTNTPANFWQRVNKTDACWLWTGCLSRRTYGYGQLRVDHKCWLAHRYSWELANGPIPEGMHVLHLCDNPPCVRPHHLFLGTQADNMLDMAAKGRTGKGSAIVTVADVAAIRLEYRAGARQSTLAAKYGINQSNISRIVTYRTWSQK